ncbi:hypothetical protein V3474_29415, partial [Pseudomonas aeruginosa]|uniref:hypothetical protein n=1 Tax=Pseudomonas aeruginosa TaxID=287 RepID=UPI002F9368E6
FLMPKSWGELSRDAGPPPFTIILTGAFEPPSETGRGQLQLLTYRAITLETLKTADVNIDEEHAGRAVIDAITGLFGESDLQLGPIADLRE